MSSRYSPLPDQTSQSIDWWDVPPLAQTVTAVPGSMKDWALDFRDDESFVQGSYVGTGVRLLDRPRTLDPFSRRAIPMPSAICAHSEMLFSSNSTRMSDDSESQLLIRIEEEARRTASPRSADGSYGKSVQSRSNYSGISSPGPPGTDRQPRREKLPPSRYRSKGPNNRSNHGELKDYGTAAPEERQQLRNQATSLSEFKIDGWSTVYDGFSQFSFAIPANIAGKNRNEGAVSSFNGSAEPIIFNQYNDPYQATAIEQHQQDIHMTGEPVRNSEYVLWENIPAF